jgi:hypothetical protein
VRPFSSEEVLLIQRDQDPQARKVKRLASIISREVARGDGDVLCNEIFQGALGETKHFGPATSFHQHVISRPNLLRIAERA